MWFLYYPYMLFFAMFDPVDPDALDESVGALESGDQVMAVKMGACLKIFTFVKFNVHMVMGKEDDKYICFRFIKERDYFAYTLGAVEGDPMVKLVKMRL